MKVTILSFLIVTLCKCSPSLSAPPTSTTSASTSPQYILQLGTFSKITIKSPTFVTGEKAIPDALKGSVFLRSYFERMRSQRFGVNPGEPIERAITRVRNCIWDSLADPGGRTNPIEAYAAICTNFNRATGKLAIDGAKWSGGVVVKATTPTELVLDTGIWLREIHKGIADSLDPKSAPSPPRKPSVKLSYRRCFDPPPATQQEFLAFEKECGGILKTCAIPYFDEMKAVSLTNVDCAEICPKGKFVHRPSLQLRLLDYPPGSKGHIPDMLEGLKRGYERAGARFPPDFKFSAGTPKELMKLLSRECLSCPSGMTMINGECLDKFGCSFPFEHYDDKLGRCDSDLENVCKYGTKDSTGLTHCKEDCERRCSEAQTDLTKRISELKIVISSLEATPRGNFDGQGGYLGYIVSARAISRAIPFRRNPESVLSGLRGIQSKMESDLVNITPSACKGNIIDGCKYNPNWIEDDYARLLGRNCYINGNCEAEHSCQCRTAVYDTTDKFTELFQSRRQIGICNTLQISSPLIALRDAIANELWDLDSTCHEHPENSEICDRATFPSDSQILQYLENRGVNCRPNAGAAKSKPPNPPPSPTPSQTVLEGGI